MDSYIARQPIFDKSVQIFAYELLFRSGAMDSTYKSVDADQASSRIIMESFHSMGVDTITGGKPAFINFTSTLLLENVATLFPKDLLVVEVLESIEPTREIVEVCRDLYQKGYKIALDDFVYRPELEPLIELSEIIKFDFLACTPQEISEMLKVMNVKGKRLLAEKIESIEMFNLASEMGFELFQGFFFSKPVTLTSRNLTPLKGNYVTLLKEMNAGHNMDFDKLTATIRNDVALSYKLLRLVNSAYYGLRSTVTDIKHALAVLGTKEIRKWISLMAMIGLSSNKPDELIRMSLIRGNFLEQMGPRCRMRATGENMFLTGLFSFIDVMTDQPMSAALGGMVLAPEVYDALVENTGQLYNLLQMVISLEQGAWDEVDELAASFGVNTQQVTEVYLQSVKWCNEMPL